MKELFAALMINKIRFFITIIYNLPNRIKKQYIWQIKNSYTLPNHVFFIPLWRIIKYKNNGNHWQV
jgi:hypothetical protein